MSFSRSFASLSLVAAALAITLPLAGPAHAGRGGDDACSVVAAPAKKAKRKLGLGGLLSAAGNSGLVGSVIGGSGGRRGVGSALSDAARTVASQAADKAMACAGGAIASGEQDVPAQDGTPAKTRQPTVMNQSGSVHPVSRSAPKTVRRAQAVEPADYRPR